MLVGTSAGTPLFLNGQPCPHSSLRSATKRQQVGKAFAPTESLLSLDLHGIVALQEMESCLKGTGDSASDAQLTELKKAVASEGCMPGAHLAPRIP